ncbi:2-oxoadipate dioxygenase/decarboxylase [Exophiala dermatitidis]
MHPVGYYDLSLVGFPLHATAFRPLTSEALARNPFRVFTSLLRLDLLPAKTSTLAQQVLSKRKLFSDRLMELLDQAESTGLTTSEEEAELLEEALKIFKWHATTQTSYDSYKQLNSVHPMVADIACFPSAHINHLTPRTLDIDQVQEAMQKHGMPAKDRIEGPPRRKCDILLRQTSFKALEERVQFVDDNGNVTVSHHTARFGEVEQRGAAVTRKGRDLYDTLLERADSIAVSKGAAGSVSNDEWQKILQEAFSEYPDTWAELRNQRLVYFRYVPVANPNDTLQAGGKVFRLSELLDRGLIKYEAITYEDFLPISAAGIFTSNLKGFSNTKRKEAQGNRQLLEQALPTKVLDSTALYEQLEVESIENCRKALGLLGIKSD